MRANKSKLMFTMKDATQRFIGYALTTKIPDSKDVDNYSDGRVESPFRKYSDLITTKISARNEVEKTPSPTTVGSEPNPKEDYFFSLYQNAKKTIQNAPPCVTGASSPPEKKPSYLTITTTTTTRSPNSRMEIHSPLNYPDTPPPTTNLSLFRKPPPTLNLPTSPNDMINKLPLHPHPRHHHHILPSPSLPPTSMFSSRQRECLTGNCKWLFPLDRCHACRPDGLPYGPGNIPLHQRGFFSNEFLLRQKEKWRRPRTVYTEKQLTALEKAYKKNKYLRGQERKELCKTLSLEERHIKVWYQNRRAKERGQIRHDKWLQRTKRHQLKRENNNKPTQQKNLGSDQIESPSSKS